MEQKTKKNNGCLWLFVFVLISFIGAIVIASILNIQWIISFVIAGIIAALLTSKLIGKPTISSLLKNVGFIFFLIIGIRFLFLFIIEFVKIPASDDITFNIEEGVAKSTILEGVDSISVYSSNRVWKDNYGNNYQGKLTVREKDFLRLFRTTDGFRPVSGSNFWGMLYDYIDRTDTPSLDLVMKAFEEIHLNKKLNQMEFAEMVISCIQDIPYSFVFQEACLPADSYEDSIRTVLEDCPDCCIGNIKYGIQNPVSFLQNLKGDCDTRTVLIYSILKHFNYDVAILNSTFYRHSIIGINIPATGLFKTHYGKKYVVWETTAKYYTAGQLPGNFNDITHWNVVLTSK